MALGRTRGGSVNNMAPRGVLTPSNSSKILKKDRILQALTKMNDRDTQKAAAEDLLSLVYNMDQEGLPIILSCLCATGSEHKVYARKECARAIGIIASEACPLREQALQQPHLGKMLGQLRKSLQDADSSVREASSEAVALVAQGLSQVAPGGVHGSLTNPALKLVFDCLGEQRKELNAAACVALGMAAPYLGTLDASLARELVRKLNSASFQAPGALLGALARTDAATGEPSGLVKSGPAAFLPILTSLVGQPAAPSLGAASSGGGGAPSGSGAVGALSRPDWQVRLAAADMLRATALLLGPLLEMDGSWAAGDPRSVTGRAIRGLESCRFDKVREVREVARAALAVMEDLHEYGSAGGSAAGWPEYIAERLGIRGLPAGLPGSPKAAYAAAPAPAPAHPSGPGAGAGPRRSPSRRSQISPARRPRSAQPHPSPGRQRSPTPPERRSSPALVRGGSVAERFRAAHRDEGIAVHDPLGRLEFEAGRGGEEEEEAWGEEQQQPPEEEPSGVAWSNARSRHAPPDDTLPDAQPASRALAHQPSAAGSDRSRAALNGQLSARAPSGPLHPAGRAEPGPAAGDPGALLRQLGLEDDGLDLLGPDGPPTFSRQVSGSSAPTSALPCAGPSSVADPAAQPPSCSGPLPLPAGPTVTLPTEQWLAAQQRLRALEAQQREMLDAFNNLSEQSGRAIATLQAKVRSLEAALEAAHAASSSLPQPLSQPQPQPQPQPQAYAASASQAPPGPAAPLPQQESSSLLAPLQDSEAPMLLRTARPGSRLLAAACAGGGAAGRLEALAAAEGCGVASPSGLPPQLPSAWASPRTSQDMPSASALSAASDVRQAYREALSGGRLSDMHLLRLMQRTGPVWHQLGHHLASQLLGAFTASLQQARADGPMLSRMMPWLWRLADDVSNQFEAPFEMRAPLLAALRTAQPSVTDAALYEKITLLITTLRTHWSLPDPCPSNGRPAGPADPSQLPQQPAGPLAPAAVPPATSRLAAAYGGGVMPMLPPQTAAAVASAAAAYGIASPSSPATAGCIGAASTEAASPGQEAAVSTLATPAARMPAQMQQHAGRSPSISSLMGQWSDLQRDFAAMASPAGKLAMPQPR
ncbi:hypothetical protein Agub_g1752 [Astrephomene gubernaculifera]|uniref:Uncharacterized protein n=1 Tax=Astrephomene gubernaculifera TaxID=47775 RepID=A0AAD3HHK3_9CHLO|nr:hypothetical protein Agub_g1752 [Astrephomene gubernaculifera]